MIVVGGNYLKSWTDTNPTTTAKTTETAVEKTEVENANAKQTTVVENKTTVVDSTASKV